MFSKFVSSKSILAAAIVSSIASFTAPAFSQQTATGTLQITAVVQAACTFGTLAQANSIFNFSFGNFQAGGADLTPAPAIVDVECASSATTAVLSSPDAVVAAPGSRNMLNGTNVLKYDLYTNASRTTVFGGVTGTISVAGGAARQVPIYGTIPSAPNLSAAPGTYNDTVNLTLTF
jgi:spore coat protein U-like protein